MAVVIDHQPVVVAPGVQSAVGNVGNNTTFTLRVARQTTATPGFWAAGVTLNMLLESSEDSGATWRDIGGFVADGGIHTRGAGGPESPEQIYSTTISPAVDRLRATFTVTGGTLVSEVTVEAT